MNKQLPERPDLGQLKQQVKELPGEVRAGHRLVVAGKDLNAPDRRFHAPPLGWCVHGSTNCRAVGGDYAAVAELLLAAGAGPLREVNAAGAAPEVAAVLARFAKATG